MFPGGRGMNPKQMKAMMRKMGIKEETIEGVEEVVVRTRDREIVFLRPEVQSITMKGQVTFKVVGQPEERALDSGSAGSGEAPVAKAGPSRTFSQDDIQLVMGQTGASEEDAIAAIEACDGEVAEAIIKLIS